MSSRNQCTPPPSPAADWDESAAFRETTLRHYTQPGEADVLRRLGAMVHDMALELAPVWPRVPGSATAAQLRAAVADLRFLASYLAAAGHDRFVSNLGPEDTALSELAERQAAEVARIAETLERAIG